jgi:hypothetical protein
MHTWEDPDTALGRISAELERLDLGEHVAGLDANGLTVVPPARVATSDVVGESPGGASPWLEGYREHVIKDMLDRHPRRFAQLLGQHVPTGSTEVGPDLDKVYHAVARTPWD